MKKILLLILITCISFSAAGCQKQEIKPSDVVFTIYDKQVTFEFFDYYLKTAKDNLVAEANAKSWNEIKKKKNGDMTYSVYAINRAIQNVSEYYTVLDLFDKAKLPWTNDNEKNANENFQNYRSGYNDTNWQKHLKESKSTEQIWKDYFIYDIKKTSVTDYLFTKQGGLTITTDEVTKLFTEEYARAKNIIVTNKDANGKLYTGQALQQAKDLADKILNRAKTEDFEKLLAEYSEDKKSNEGFILDINGYNAKGEEFDKKLAEFIFSLDINEVSTITTDFGIHIIKRYPNDVKFIDPYYDFLEFKAKTEKAFKYIEDTATNAKKDLNRDILDKIK